MAKKKKLLFVIWSYTYGGGAEAILSNLVNRLDPAKYEIDILEYWHSNIKKEETNANINILKPIIDSTKDGHLKMWTVKILLEHFPSILRKIYLKKEYDYEIAFNMLIPTYFLSKKGKTIAWIHSDIYFLKNEFYQFHLQKKAFKHLNRIVAISENTYNSILELYPEYKDKTVIINNSFDFNKIEEKVKEKVTIKKNKFTFLYAGRFEERKNPFYLIDIVKDLKEVTKDFEVWMIGHGELENAVKEKIKENNLEQYIKLLGFKTNPYPYFQKSDAIIMTSLSEGFPTVIAEGLFLGKPFITTPVGGSTELANGGKCGIIAANKDEFIKGMQRLIKEKNYYQKLSQNGKEYIKQFTYQKQIKKFENLLEDINNEKVK